MSRIDDALRRSHGVDLVPAGDPRTEPFRSAWALDEAADGPGRTRASRLDAPTDQPPLPGGVVGGFNPEWKERLVVSPDADPFLVEQFRRLAATLHQSQISSGLRSVLLTSALPGDGKTQTAINLALILSESYKRRVLLIDADLRRPSIRDVSHLPNVVGLADGLRAKADQKLTVFKLTQNLSLLPAGRPDADPMGGLTSPRMRSIVADASAHYDWVLLDAPPVGTVADASILADMVDGVLFVVRSGRTDYAIARKAIDAIGRERILGAVLNGVEGTKSSAYAYYHAPDAASGQLARS